MTETSHLRNRSRRKSLLTWQDMENNQQKWVNLSFVAASLLLAYVVFAMATKFSVVFDVEGRVRQLLAPRPRAPRTKARIGLAGCALLLPVVSVPLYGFVHEFIEILVAFGR